MRRLDKNILQDIEINWGNDWCIEDNKEYEEISWRSKHNGDRDRKIYPSNKYWQLDDEYHEYCRNIRRFTIPSSKWYRRLSIPSPKDVGGWTEQIQRKR